jgi:hypothetical protein
MSNGARVENVETVSDDSIFDLKTLFRGMWRWKWLVLLAAVAGTGVGVRNIEKFVPTYRASMIVAPGNTRDSVSLSSGGAANLVSLGQSLGMVGQISTTNIPFEQFKVLISSMQLAKILQEKYQILQMIHLKSWDEANKRWIKPAMLKDSLGMRARRYFHVNDWQEPGLESLATYLGGAVQIKKLLKSPFYEISVNHSDREFAEFVLKIVHSEADQLISEQDRKKTIARRRYLEERLETAQLAEVRSILLALLVKFEQDATLTNTDAPNVLSIIEPVHVSGQPNEPAFLRMLGMPIGVAIIIAMALIATVTAYRHE